MECLIALAASYATIGWTNYIRNTRSGTRIINSFHHGDLNIAQAQMRTGYLAKVWVNNKLYASGRFSPLDSRIRTFIPLGTPISTSLTVWLSNPQVNEFTGGNHEYYLFCLKYGFPHIKDSNKNIKIEYEPFNGWVALQKKSNIIDWHVLSTFSQQEFTNRMALHYRYPFLFTTTALCIISCGYLWSS